MDGGKGGFRVAAINGVLLNYNMFLFNDDRLVLISSALDYVLVANCCELCCYSLSYWLRSMECKGPPLHLIVGSRTRDRSKGEPGLMGKDLRSSGSGDIQPGKKEVLAIFNQSRGKTKKSSLLHLTSSE
jgi:hypothetical protein